MEFEKGSKIIWKDRKRYLGMPISFYRYYIVEKEGEWVKFFRHKGLLHSVIDEINVYRCYDVRLTVNFFDKIFRTGTIEICSNDAHAPIFHFRRIKHPYEVRDMVSDLIERERRKHRVGITEFQTPDMH